MSVLSKIETTIGLSLGLFLLSQLLPGVRQDQKLQWKGKIEDENGVKVIRNPQEPIYGQDIFSLEDELSIGKAKGREEYIFYRPIDIEADSEGNIYVLDSGDKNIKAYDKKGRFLKIISRKGQGPGELSAPVDIFIDGRNRIYVSDSENSRITVFNTEGSFVNSFSLKEYSPGKIVGVNPSGDLILVVNKFSSASDKNFIELDYIVNAYSAGFDFINNLYVVSIPIMQQFVKDGRRIALGALFPKSLCCAVGSLGNIYLADSQEYKIQVYSPEGKLIHRILRECEAEKVSRRDIEDYLNGFFQENKDEKKFWSGIVEAELKVPERKPFFDRFFFARDRLLVLRLGNGKGKKSFLDIFDADGRYIAGAHLSVLPRIWKKDKLYTIEEDEEGYQLIRRYKVNWKI